MQPSLEDVQLMLDHHFGQFRVTRSTQILNKGFSFSRQYRTYVLDLVLATASDSDTPTHSAFLTVSGPIDSGSSSGDWHTNSLSVAAKLITVITSQTSIPVAQSVLDTSRTIVPYDLLLTPPYHIPSANMVSLADAKAQNLLSIEQLTFIDIYLGKFLGQLHSGVLNEWFGLPQLSEPQDPSSSWQESFILLFESLLSEFEAQGPPSDIQITECRQYFSRAIAYFLFDDVQVPSLVWFTGSEHDIYVTFNPGDPSPQSISIAAILPNLAHAVWGDPLLETLFMPPGPSKALNEAYLDSGGEQLIIFPRQKAKRIWYSCFLALLVLVEHPETDEKRSWALDTLRDSIVTLRDAQMY